MGLQLVKLLDPIALTIAGTFTHKGDYDNATDYAVGDAVNYQGSGYIMHTNAAAGTLPTDTTKWYKYVNKGDTGADGADATISDTAYGASWNGVTDVAPSKNAVYDKIETISAGGISDGDKGDITVSGSGATWTVDNDAITYAKMQNVSAENKILGRITAGAGNTEELTAANVRTIINVEDGADVTDTANVTAAGALMDSEVTNLADVKAFDPTDYATAAQGTLADSAVQDLADLSITASAAELNTLDGITATTAELNYTDGVTSAIQTQLDGKVDENAAITGATKTKITYDAKGLVTAGADATKADVGLGNVDNTSDATKNAASVTLTNKTIDGDDNTIQDLDDGVFKSTADVLKGMLGLHINGGGSAITTGLKGYIHVPYNCTITKWVLLGVTSGSCTIDIWKDAYANYPPTVADTITASAKPAIAASGVKNESSSLTGWTTTLSQGDVLGINVDAASGLTELQVILEVRKT